MQGRWVDTFYHMIFSAMHNVPYTVAVHLWTFWCVICTSIISYYGQAFNFVIQFFVFPVLFIKITKLLFKYFNFLFTHWLDFVLKCLSSTKQGFSKIKKVFSFLFPFLLQIRLTDDVICDKLFKYEVKTLF